MKKALLPIFILSIPLLIAIALLIRKEMIIRENYVPKHTKTEIEYYINVENIYTDTEIPVSSYIAANKDELKYIENKFNINLSEKFKHYLEYKNDNFIYFIEFNTTTSSGNYNDATDLIINKYTAYFQYDNNKSIENNSPNPRVYSTVMGTQIAIAAVPKEAIDPEYPLTTGFCVNNDGVPWNILVCN